MPEATPEFQQVHTLMQERGIRMVDLRFTDLVGAWHHVTLPTGRFTPELCQAGVAFDGSSVAGFKRVEGGDMVLVPDLTTAAVDPFFELPTLTLICWIRESGSGEAFPRDPRVIAARAEAALGASGIADRSLWGPEFEFYVFDHVASTNTHNRCGYAIDAAEGHWNTGEERTRHLGARIRHQGGYHVIPPLDALHDTRSAMAENIEAHGIPVKYHHHEVGGAGQCEIEIELQPLLKAADAVMVIKYLIKMTARQRGHTATFMPKPLVEEAGSGMHFHQLLLRGTEDCAVFADPKGYAGLSETARFYIGGLLQHTPALLAITNPSTNSYRRLVPGFEAPTRLFFGLANRSAAVRIPKQAMGPMERRMEFRCPDGTCNPYLAMAAQLLAGLDGIRRRIDPTAQGFGPYDFNVCELPPDESAKIRSAPADLEGALEALEADADFLQPGEVFPKDFVETWVRYKLEHDVRPLRERTHPYEVELYYDV